MKEKRILNALEQVDEKFIEDASPANQKVKKPVRARWIAVAAAACVCIVAGIMLIPGNKPDQTSVGGVLREYRNATVIGSEEAIEWPWEYKTVFERFSTIVFDGKEYVIKTSGQSANDTFIGEKLGIGEGSGYDVYSNQIYSQDFDIWQIKGISAELMIAAEMDGQFYAFSLNEYDPPATLGDVLDNYSLPQTLDFLYFSEYKEGKETGYYSLTDDNYIWQVLSDCRDAQFVEDGGGGYIGKDRISFTATSSPLGVYKRGFYVSTDGYVSTNIFNWLYTFNIGEKAAEDIISYAKNNAKKADYEPYTYSLAGTLTEIGDGYVIVDDSILCNNEKDGMTFKVLTSDMRISRCIDFQKIEVGSIVVIQFTDPVNVQDDNTISSAVSMTRGYINDGSVNVLE